MSPARAHLLARYGLRPHSKATAAVETLASTRVIALYREGPVPPLRFTIAAAERLARELMAAGETELARRIDEQVSKARGAP